MPEALHEKALLFYQNYLFVGGMPKCVADFIDKGKRIPDFDRNIQDNILLAYAVRPHANKRDFYQPLDWLKTALLINKVNRVELPQSPLKIYGDEGIFKI